eukprot:2636970-Ditylum_brightwellii.AAC.1
MGSNKNKKQITYKAEGDCFQEDALCQDDVTCKGMCGIPPSVIQEEKKRHDDQICACGTVKAAVLEGDPNCPQFVVCSVYNTKPVHFLSMKQISNVDSGNTETTTFLHVNTIQSYNMTIGSVDLADQLCGKYHINNGVRNRKWWSVMFWSIGVMLTNAFIMYVKVNEENGLEKKDLLLHHDFCKCIAMAWINPNEYKERQMYVKTATIATPTSITTSRSKRECTSSQISMFSSISSITMDSSVPQTKKVTKFTPRHWHQEGPFQCS